MGQQTGRCTVLGLTGSSGSGKSAVAKILSSMGAAIIDADAVARAVVERREVVGELAQALGSQIVGADGGFDRAYASERAFKDKGFLDRLTEITHKFITIDIINRVGELQKQPCAARVIVIDAPLPIEHGFLDLADVVWVVSASRERRLCRVTRRDKISADAASARFASQLPDSEYEKLADVLIDNNGAPGELEAEVKRQFALLRQTRR